MARIESTNAELIAAVREWEATEFGVHKMMSVLAGRLDESGNELIRATEAIEQINAWRAGSEGVKTLGDSTAMDWELDHILDRYQSGEGAV